MTIKQLFKRDAADYGRPNLWFRLYRLRLRHGLLISAPALFICLWYAFIAVTSHSRHLRGVGEEQPLTLEVFQLHLHDALTRDLRRLTAPPETGPSDMPDLNLHLSNASLDQLDQAVPPTDGRSSYVDGLLQDGGTFHKVRVRYRGRKHWHWNHPQKSWKVRMDGGDFLHGLATFNFVNTPDPMPFDEQVVMDLAREEGLLTPAYHPFRLLLNNSPMGIMFFAAQPGEGLLRNHDRIPGGIFSGNGAPADPATGISSLWQSKEHWKKVAARIGPKKHLKDFTALEHLLRAVNTREDREFAEFARRHLDMQRFALFDALDVVFGGNQHDFNENHKIFFDQYKARFEPIAWNFRGWDHRRRLNRTENPLLLRLKATPEYLLLRNREVLRLLDGPCSPEALLERFVGLLEDLAPEQTRDPYWDAYHLLPGLNKYIRQMVRPMTAARQQLVLKAKLAHMRRRHDFLKQELLLPDHSMTFVQGERPGDLWLEIRTGGRAGLRLDSIELIPARACPMVGVQVTPDPDLPGSPAPRLAEEREVPMGVDLLPGVQLVPRRPHPARGNVRAEPAANRYRFAVRSSDCPPAAALVRGRSMLDRTPFEERIPLTRGESSPSPVGCAPTAPIGAPGRTSMHPWCHERPRERELVLGPGLVKLKRSLEVLPGQTMTIRPGTTLKFKKKASLIVRGRLLARGTAEAPIVLMPKGRSWRGVALMGPGTAGSRLEHVQIFGARTPKWDMGSFPGTLNIHDTSDIRLERVRVEGSSEAEDLVHIAYVDGLRILGLEVLDAPSDALDLEFCKAKISKLACLRAGDECLDLMGSKVKMDRSLMLDWGGSAISVGERSRLRISDSLLAGSGGTGILVKNRSRLKAERLVLTGATPAMELRNLSPRYGGRCRLRATDCYVLDSEEALRTDRGLKEEPEWFLQAPTEGGLEELRRGLGLDRWSDLDSFLERSRRQP